MSSHFDAFRFRSSERFLIYFSLGDVPHAEDEAPPADEEKPAPPVSNRHAAPENRGKASKARQEHLKAEENERNRELPRITRGIEKTAAAPSGWSKKDWEWAQKTQRDMKWQEDTILQKANETGSNLIVGPHGLLLGYAPAGKSLQDVLTENFDKDTALSAPATLSTPKAYLKKYPGGAYEDRYDSQSADVSSKEPSRKGTQGREAATTDNEAAKTPGEMNEKGVEHLEQRIATLNKRARGLADELPSTVRQNSKMASYASQNEFAVRNGKPCLVVRATDGLPFDKPSMSLMIRFSLDSMTASLPPESKSQMSYEITSGALYCYAPIDCLERVMDKDEAVWSTKDAAKEETAEAREQFNRRILPPVAATSEPKLNDMETYNDQLRSIMRAAPQGMDKTMWGRVMNSANFQEDEEGHAFFSVPSKYAAEFRKCAHVLLPGFEAKTTNASDGGYRVRLTSEEVSGLVRQAKLHTTNDIWVIVESDPVLREAARKFLPADGLKGLDERSKKKNLDAAAKSVLASKAAFI